MLGTRHLISLRRTLVVLGTLAFAALIAGPALAADDVGVFDDETGVWYLRDDVTGSTTAFYFGNPGDEAFVGDWDCDGVDTPGLYRQSDGFVYLRNSNTQGVADVEFFFGNPGDIPVPGDFDGDGCDSVSVYRPSTTTVFIINGLGADGAGLGAADFAYTYGDPGDVPVSGDTDGDGFDTISLHRIADDLLYLNDDLGRRRRGERRGRGRTHAGHRGMARCRWGGGLRHAECRLSPFPAPVSSSTGHRT